MVLESSLNYADREQWQNEPGYADVAAQLLKQIFVLRALVEVRASPQQTLTLHALAARRTTLGQLAALTEQLERRPTMSPRQRMIARFVRGEALVEEGQQEEGVAQYQCALKLADAVPDEAAGVMLARLAGLAERSRSQYGAGARLQREALRRLRKLGAQGKSAEVETEFAILLALAVCEFTLGEYPMATRSLDEAWRLLPGGAIGPWQVASWQWMQAIVLRWEDHPDQALPLVGEARNQYARAASYAERYAAGRFFSAAAELVLDLASAAAPGAPARGTWAKLAQSYADTALQHGTALDDDVGELLALLALARLDILSGQYQQALAVLEGVRSRAWTIGDTPVRVQTYAMLGRLYEARGDRDAARVEYRAALRALDAHEAFAMGKWARDGLGRIGS
jgi:tetratricopeptide (TPR) repeat protein